MNRHVHRIHSNKLLLYVYTTVQWGYSTTSKIDCIACLKRPSVLGLCKSLLNMKDNKIVLIFHHLLESSIGAYIEWIVNKLMMTDKKNLI